MASYEYWPDTDAVAVCEDDGQVRLLILDISDNNLISECVNAYPVPPHTRG